jgi:antitoxin VapB
MATAKVFKHRNSQAVRLPKEFRVRAKELEISKRGDVITLRPKKITYEQALAAVARSRGGIKRDQESDQERDWGSDG